MQYISITIWLSRHLNYIKDVLIYDYGIIYCFHDRIELIICLSSWRIVWMCNVYVLQLYLIKGWITWILARVKIRSTHYIQKSQKHKFVKIDKDAWICLVWWRDGFLCIFTLAFLIFLSHAGGLGQFSNPVGQSFTLT